MKRLYKISLLLVLLALIGSCGVEPIIEQPTVHPETPAATTTPVARETPAPQSNVETIVNKLQGLDIDEFFEASYHELLRRDPELLTELGLSDLFGVGNDQLTDISDAYIRETLALEAAILDLLNQYDRDELTPEQRLSADIYAAYLEDEVDRQDFMYNDYPVTHFLTGVQNQLIHFFTDIHPVADQKDAQDYVTRLSQVDTKFEQLLEGLKLREEAGVVLPRFIVQWVLHDLQRMANGDPRSVPFYTVFAEKVNALDGINTADKEALLAAAEQEIQDSVLPAFKALAEYFEYLETIATDDDGVWKFPNGEQYYAYALRHHTTTDMTADEIHELGLQELDRIHAEMRAIFDELGYPQDESLPELFARVATDGGSLSGPQVVDGYEQIIEEMDQQLASVFDLRPQADVIVIGGPTGGYYVGPAVDGSRPGAFYASVQGSEPWFGMPTLAYHEAIPGHHLQIAIALELDLPSFRKGSQFTAYVEGWALYAERLAWEMGLYEDDPYGNLGRLQAEAFRAARLVIDTGIHTKKWTYDQGVEFMLENTGLPRGQVDFEVSRYITWPGQAVSYKIGMIKILELRQKAMEQLGDEFDLKEFHNVVLGNGSVPLEILEQVVDEYIAQAATGTSVSADAPAPAETATPAASPTPTTPPPSAEPKEIGELELTIVYDNTTYDSSLTADWGFSAWIEYDGHTLLFDTGANGSILLDNMAKLDLDPQQIEIVVLSHIHGDHTNGLQDLLALGIKPTVYVPASFPASFKNDVRTHTELVEVTGEIEILPGVHSTGQLGDLVEQSLVVETPEGLVVVTGCSHPGISYILRKVRRMIEGEIALVVGGFHLMETSRTGLEGIISTFRRYGVKQVTPTHCTGETAISMFAEEYGDDYVEGGVGRTITVGAGSSADAPSPAATLPLVETIQNVPYVPDGHFEQKLDVYLPTQGEGPFPILFMIHEGNGRKEQLSYWGRSFAEQGYAAVSINHRQWPDYKYPAHVEDAFCALAWVHANAPTYGFDTDHVFALGHSAGGTLAAMLGVVDDPAIYLEECPYSLPESNWVHGIVPFTGIFDYAGAVELAATLNDYASDLLGGELDEQPETWAKASAVTWVDGSEPPFLLIHGEKDNNISPANSRDFAEALEAAGVEVELLIVPDAAHAQITKSEQSLEAVAAFLARLRGP